MLCYMLTSTLTIHQTSEKKMRSKIVGGSSKKYWLLDIFFIFDVTIETIFVHA